MVAYNCFKKLLKNLKATHKQVDAKNVLLLFLSFLFSFDSRLFSLDGSWQRNVNVFFLNVIFLITARRI